MSTFEAGDFQITLNAGESRAASCKQSLSSSASPGALGTFGALGFTAANKLENIVFRPWNVVGDRGARDIPNVNEGDPELKPLLFQRTKEL